MWTTPRDTVVRRLEEVGCTIAGEGENLQVTPPTWRTDITVPVELVEEVVRLEGLDDIPSILPTPRGGRGLSPLQRRRRAVTHALAYSGYAEIIPTPFIANDTFDVWGLDADDPRRNTVKVQNPLDADYGILGTTLLPSMLEAAGRKGARGRGDIALYAVAQTSEKRADVSPLPAVTQRPADDVVAELIQSLPKQNLHAATVALGNVELEGPWGNCLLYTSDAADEVRRV